MTYKEFMPLIRNVVPDEFLRFPDCTDKSLLYELVRPSATKSRKTIEGYSVPTFNSYTGNSENRSIRSLTKKIAADCSPDSFMSFLEEIDNSDDYQGDISSKLETNFISHIEDINDSTAICLVSKEFAKIIQEEANRKNSCKPKQKNTSSTCTVEEENCSDEFQSYFEQNPDAASLIENMKIHNSLYVETKAFKKALNIIDTTGRILIIGEPGIGKSIISEMIAREYLRRGFAVQCALRGELISEILIRVKSQQDKKELIYIDDCLGQAYFDLTSPHENELKNLVAFVTQCKNKVMLLNSRVTIYNGAIKRDSNLSLTFNSLDEANAIFLVEKYTNLEKAKILFQHLLVKPAVTNAHYQDLLIGHRYFDIINHKNYNPRIMEHITSRTYLKNVPPELFFNKAMMMLNDPKTAWDDEFQNNIENRDRLLLITIYSLSDKMVDYELCKKVFEKRILTEPDINHDADNFEDAIAVLSDSMIHVDISYDCKTRKEIRLIGVANPSINDYIEKSILKEGSVALSNERNHIVAEKQIARLYSYTRLESEYKRRTLNKSILDLYFDSDINKKNIIAKWVINSQCMFEEYKPYIKRFLSEAPKNAHYFSFFHEDVELFIKLVQNREFYAYYIGTPISLVTQKYFFEKVTIPELFRIFSASEENNHLFFDIHSSNNYEMVESAKEHAIENTLNDGFSYIDELVQDELRWSDDCDADDIYEKLRNIIRENCSNALKNSPYILIMNDMAKRLKKRINDYEDTYLDSIHDSINSTTTYEEEEEDEDGDEDEDEEFKAIYKLFSEQTIK